VTDPTNATVPSAKVILTNVNTGVTAQTTMRPDGNFVFPLLAPGHRGISIITRKRFSLRLGDILRTVPGLNDYSRSDCEILFSEQRSDTRSTKSSLTFPSARLGLVRKPI
jgi:hypothetical protein